MKNSQLPNGHGRLVCKYCRRLILACKCHNHTREFFGVCQDCKGKRELSPFDQYMLYARGWRDGGACTAMRHSEIEVYCRGYEDGRKARNEAITAFCKEIGYEPQILRVQEGILDGS